MIDEFLRDENGATAIKYGETAVSVAVTRMVALETTEIAAVALVRPGKTSLDAGKAHVTARQPRTCSAQQAHGDLDHVFA
jgi:Flp pilus assembly pilin Flp